MGWHEELLVGFDLETTGTDPAHARIVSAAVTEVAAGRPVRHRCWLVDPGLPIPPEATAIHGITTARARAAGRPPREAVAEIAQALTGHWAAGVPVVAYNAPFDLTLLTAELARHGLPPLPVPPGPVIDPLVVDRALDRDRPGRRTLQAACAEYGVVLGRAHQAESDALAAVQVARALARRYPQLARRDPWELHHSQAAWHAEWSARKDAHRTPPGWPLHHRAPHHRVPDPSIPAADPVRTGTSAP
ncbi:MULTISPECIES: exonuclease domain-containing protein [Streptomycetaceae]|uniref:DNA polymerase III subunit epsilon n=1 Tax=Streptantibioticus cattleyicolor (strain ATCC 35852 / DSM 46488 / JCM 4925 / NBRC 14057 / NRRL 8057) TaxID=1003195 RepID=F8JWS8_STREN|nr:MULTISPECIES: exonuclease domain-containing protein [Streptomycetaceae]AEW97083.1 DNA polymerase III subunit epsilon [Streptantibioticus cattleyicolor NRRL 8057 = DSM 46488]MYS61544.1 3'-5' exonuclease [Streptomyces sp. SID5468]CCB77406.1 DNA polymerase III subunit epsilon [Streptantibioticus cattleyicolor NRRL 8057 = DSM 46488]